MKAGFHTRFFSGKEKSKIKSEIKEVFLNFFSLNQRIQNLALDWIYRGIIPKHNLLPPLLIKEKIFSCRILWARKRERKREKGREKERDGERERERKRGREREEKGEREKENGKRKRERVRE